MNQAGRPAGVLISPRLLLEIIRRLGGISPVARRLGLSRNAPHKWIARQRIPPERLEDLRAMLRESRDRTR